MNLPASPGLQRRLAYANLVREAHFPQFYDDSPSIEYEIFYNLHDVKIGLINECILKRTSVNINCKNDQFCVICQDHIGNNIIIRTLACDHSFHLHCIDKWFSENTKCPTCNKDIRDDRDIRETR